VDLAEQVRLQNLPEHLGRGLLERAVAEDRGSAHPGVDAAVRVHGRVGQRLHLRLVAHVRDHDQGSAAELGALPRDLLQAGFAPGRQHQLGTALGERVRRGPTVTARRTGDDHDAPQRDPLASAHPPTVPPRTSV
jgi:hypothetical protein